MKAQIDGVIVYKCRTGRYEYLENFEEKWFKDGMYVGRYDTYIFVKNHTIYFDVDKSIF